MIRKTYLKNCILVAERLGISKRGNRYFCPYCQPYGGKTPDMDIREKSYRCYKCGNTGDAIDLVKLVKNCGFIVALDWLSSDVLVAMQNNCCINQQKSRENDIRGIDPDLLDQVLREFLEKCGPLRGHALQYLTDRNISISVINKMRLSYCTSNYLITMRWLEKRYDKKTLVDCGLIKKSDHLKKWFPVFYPFWKNNLGFILFPYIENGRIVYLKARALIEIVYLELLNEDNQKAGKPAVPKYLNSAGRLISPYNVDAIADSDSVIITEGEIDCLTALSCGKNAIGISGWSGFKENWCQLFAGKEVFLLLDADVAGRKGVNDIGLKFHRSGLPVPRYIELPEDRDLNDHVRETIDGYLDDFAERISNLSDSERERFEEKAAIIETESGYTRLEAEKLALSYLAKSSDDKS
jgi:DNA primase